MSSPTILNGSKLIRILPAFRNLSQGVVNCVRAWVPRHNALRYHTNRNARRPSYYLLTVNRWRYAPCRHACEQNLV
jgi:hypothetical protein